MYLGDNGSGWHPHAAHSRAVSAKIGELLLESRLPRREGKGPGAGGRTDGGVADISALQLFHEAA